MRIASVGKTLMALFIFLVVACGGFWAGHFYVSKSEPAVLYSLDKRANDQAMINIINGAQNYVYFAVYTFTKDNIADALIGAKQRGVDVRGITDTGQAETAYEKPIIQKLETAGIPVLTQKHDDGLMHIKAVVTDKAYAMGSYNWTESATVANDELLEIGTDDYVRGVYTDIIKRILTVNSSASTANSKSGAGNNMQGANGSVISTVPQATPGKIYSYVDAAAHIGETAVVEGAPIDIYTSSGGTIFFDYCKSYKNCSFSAVIFASDVPKFKNISRYQSKTIDVTGIIKNYGGKAEVAISDPEQIKFAGDDGENGL
jgi:hypothetical protein